MTWWHRHLCFRVENCHKWWNWKICDCYAKAHTQLILTWNMFLYARWGSYCKSTALICSTELCCIHCSLGLKEKCEKLEENHKSSLKQVVRNIIIYGNLKWWKTAIFFFHTYLICKILCPVYCWKLMYSCTINMQSVNIK